MRKILLLMVVMIFLASCTPAGQQPTKEGFQPEFRTGSSGMRLNFVTNNPPIKIFDTEEFSALIEVFNEGAFDVGGPGDKIYLSGFDNRIITGTPTTGKPIPKIEGKSAINSRGGQDLIDFQGKIQQIIPERVPQTVLATACYTYETVASGNVCIDPDPNTPSLRRKVCTPAPIGLGSQGAPVAVTNVELDARRGKTGFRITVQNVGGGDVFRFGGEFLQKCNPYDPTGLKFREVDYVMLADVLVGGQSIRGTCRPLDQTHIRLDNGIGTVYCELLTTGSNAFTSPITVVLRYGYRTTIQKDIAILKQQ